jgi:hypothetical protein
MIQTAARKIRDKSRVEQAQTTKSSFEISPVAKKIQSPDGIK